MIGVFGMKFCILNFKVTQFPPFLKLPDITFLVVVSTLLGASLLTANSIYANASTLMAGNFTEGINNVSSKIPTILLIAAVVLLFGVIVLLVKQSGAMGIGSGEASL